MDSTDLFWFAWCYILVGIAVIAVALGRVYSVDRKRARTAAWVCLLSPVWPVLTPLLLGWLLVKIVKGFAKAATGTFETFAWLWRVARGRE